MKYQTNFPELEQHPFLPFIPEESRYLVLGTFPGKETTGVNPNNDYNWYYGSKRNQFWSIIETIYNRKLPSLEDKKIFFTEKNIAITDIYSACRRRAGTNADANLIDQVYNKGVIENLLKNQPIIRVLTTSKKVYTEFTKYFIYPSSIEVITLPSPSPRYPRAIKAKVQIYKKYFPE